MKEKKKIMKRAKTCCLSKKELTKDQQNVIV